MRTTCVISAVPAAYEALTFSLCTMVMFAGQFLSTLLVSAFSARHLFLIAALIVFVIMLSILPVVKKYRR